MNGIHEVAGSIPAWSTISFLYSSGLYRLNQWRSLARGARLARRDEGAYRPYSTEKQRRQTGCPARRTVLIQSIQATSTARTSAGFPVGRRSR